MGKGTQRKERGGGGGGEGRFLCCTVLSYGTVEVEQSPDRKSVVQQKRMTNLRNWLHLAVACFVP